MKRAVPSAESFEENEFSWSKCCFCQGSEIKSKVKGDLQCSARHRVHGMRNKGYEKVARNLETLRGFPNFLLPSGHRVEVLDDGKGIQATLIEREAMYHKNCAREYQHPKVDALLQRLRAESEAEQTAAAAEEQSSAASTPLPSASNSTPGLSTSRSRTRSTSQVAVAAKSDVCFLCGLPGDRSRQLHLCQTKELEERVIKCAQDLGNLELLAQIVTYGDLIAQEAKYHTHCLVKLYNSAKRVTSVSKEDMDSMICESMAFADLISYLTMKLSESVQTVFVVADLVRFYSARLANLLGVEADSLPPVHSTRLREKILAKMPDLREQKAGRDVVLTHCKANVLLALEREDQDEHAIGFLKFVKTLRKCMSEAHTSFRGEFEESCEEKSVPPSLLSAVTLLLYGSKFRQNCGATKPALTISQLILFNFRQSMPKGEIVRQDRERETPFPLFLGLNAYGSGRNKAMIDELHRHGVSVSYDRVLEVSSQMCRLVVGRAEEEGVLCPSNLQKNLFTIVALDNIDFKSRSTTSGPEFHGTGISVFQITSDNSSGVTRDLRTTFEDVEQRGNRSVPPLPVSFTSTSDTFVLPDKVEPRPSDSALPGMEPSGNIVLFWKKEHAWLAHTHEQISDPGHCGNTSWGAFHAVAEKVHATPGIDAMLPLLDVKSTSPGLIKHGADLTLSMTRHLNPVQPGIMCMDQQLYLIAKKLQWFQPAHYGEERLVMLMGGFHIEKVFLAVLGQLLEKSGWVHLIGCSNVTTAGSAEGALKVSHVLRARVLHQKTAVALHSLLLNAYDEQQPDQELSLDEWIENNCCKSPTFYFWLLVLNLEILLLSFVKSQREGNFVLYQETLAEMLPWIFIFDHQNYSRWLSIHLRDLLELKQKAPVVHKAFSEGKFVFTGTGNSFSRLAIDQAHEQNNAKVKDAGGVVGLTHDPSSLHRVMAAGPEISRLLDEFRSDPSKVSNAGGKHHEEYPAYQRQFKEHCIALINSFQAYQNPFCELGRELITLDTREVVGQETAKLVFSLEKMGTDKYMEFVEKRIKSQATNFYDPILKSGIKIFANKRKPLHPNRHQQKVAQLKDDNQLYWRLYVASVSRNLDLDVFFEYENQPTPPSLSSVGKLSSGNKAELTKLLEAAAPGTHQPTVCQGLVIDGAQLMYNVQPQAGVKTFDQYFKRQLKPHVEEIAVRVLAMRIDFVYDLYSENSIKDTERESRGVGGRQKDLPTKGTLPKDWDKYLKNSENKMELFKYLSTRFVEEMGSFKVATNIEHTIQTQNISTTCLRDQHCLTMEEADPRIITHVLDMTKTGATSVLIRATDADVVVLAVSTFHRLAAIGLQELWILYGSWKKARYIAVHKISAALGPEKCEALPGFHAFTGCDTTSYFSACKKPTCWKVWEAHPEFNSVFQSLSSPLPTIEDETLCGLERYAVLIYDKNSTEQRVTLARKDMVVSGNRSIYLVPPSRGCLLQHSLRALYQAGHLWAKALEEQPKLPPPPTDFGRKLVDGKLEILWTKLPDLWSKCREVDVMCGCKKGCETRNCSCKAANLPCCAGCKSCKGNCKNGSQEQQLQDVIQEESQDDPDDPPSNI